VSNRLLWEWFNGSWGEWGGKGREEGVRSRETNLGKLRLSRAVLTRGRLRGVQCGVKGLWDAFS